MSSFVSEIAKMFFCERCVVLDQKRGRATTWKMRRAAKSGLRAHEKFERENRKRQLFS